MESALAAIVFKQNLVGRMEPLSIAADLCEESVLRSSRRGWPLILAYQKSGPPSAVATPVRLGVRKGR